MRPDDLLELLRKQPFQPFCIHVSEGANHVVRHPDQAMVGRSVVIVGVPPAQAADGPIERTVNVALIHITRTQALNGELTPT